MNHILIFLSIISSKFVEFLSKLIGRKSSAMPGKIARIIYPNILRYLGNQIQKDIIIVTGTNGKTTTNNIIRDILKVSGFTVVCNDVGANMINGITSAFLKNVNIFGKLNSEYACIETDEASLHKVVDEITPNKIVITNLFRDQLDRYGEIDLTIQLINKALKKVPENVELILNADDPLTTQFKFNHNFKTYFFGIGENTKSNVCEESREGRFCTFCGEELVYNYYFYSQLGDYYCKKCDFKRPIIDFNATNINIVDNISFNLNYNNIVESITINYSGFYNIYNCLAAISTALITGIDIENINQALSNYKPQIGRMENFKFNIPVILNLSKNPAGFNQAIDTVISDKRKKSVLIIINDNAQDGRDISWLWDCDFENLTTENVNNYYVSGLRKEDMSIRLKYAQIDENKIIIENDIRKAILKLIDENIEIGYILVNYTALFETQNILKTLQGAYGLDVKK